LWRRKFGERRRFWETLSLSLAPLARDEGIQIGGFANTLPKTGMRTIRKNVGQFYITRTSKHNLL
jgi:hypothetical protein